MISDLQVSTIKTTNGRLPMRQLWPHILYSLANLLKSVV